ncbi:MAG TPA: hypothetical protein VMV46_10510 [Thermoanaerobaculia bacterium]|nr:hypothetical protein [Thermoanaerobaculia bacterium]
MSRRFATCTLPIFLLALAIAPRAPLAAQPPKGAAESEELAAEVRRVFEQAVADQLAAEKAGSDSGGSEPDAQLLRRAAAGYSRVLEMRPGAVAARYNLGRAQAALGDLDNAETSFEQAASHPGPRRVFYLRQWADFLRDQGRWEQALGAYEEVVLLEPRLDEPHAILRERYLELRERSPQRLLSYLWRLVEGRQAARSAELAVDALEAGWPSWSRPEILAAIAASLAQWHQPPPEILDSPLVRRLRRFGGDPELGRGIAELFQLYASPGRYPDRFRWWSAPDDGWTEQRGVSRRDAFRAALRALGDDYRRRGEDSVATACYRAAIDLGDDPDPRALRSLATVYVEKSDLRALHALAARYADPAGRLFEAKNRAYQLGKLDEILDYHRALGQIYGALAVSGKTGWGSTGSPGSALFQLERAYQVARRLDAEPGSSAPESTHIDPGLTVLYAQGLRETGAVERSVEVLLEADRKYEQVGDADASRRVLQAIPQDRLPAEHVRRLERYERIEREPPAAKPSPSAPPPASQLSASQRAANREKDRAALPLLLETLRLRDARERD